MQHRVEKISRTVAGENPPRAVGPVRAGRQSQDEKPRRRRPEGRHRPAPIHLVEVSPALHARHLLYISNQPRTPPASRDLLVECSQISFVATISQMQTPFRLDGRVALVTGGASGIGEATSRAFTNAGARVIIADRDETRARPLAAELAGSSVRIFDITDETAVAREFATLESLDFLINNAGIGLVGGVEETGLEDFQRLFRVNVEGVFLVTKYAMPLLIASHGSIVNIGSVAGMIGVKRRFAYSATKGAVLAMTRQLAVDYPTQIRVNCICPGTVDTPFVEGYLQRYHAHELEKMRAELNARQPIGRVGRPDEIAHLALYLCSREAEFMNGSVITIDGGWTAG
jgi:2-keto-3-deoxy-L-fuconate dehydrogenase